ncbi:CitB Response regulator containing a CheY-like receiver domain and an HTH DNA-binding domain [Rhabdaerophilaceae bacterium]
MPSRRVRIVIVDAHPITREGLRISLEREPDLSIVGEGSDGQAAALLGVSLRPDVMILDSALKHLDCMTLVRRLQAQLPGIHIVVTFPLEEPLGLPAFVEAGVSGFLARSATPRECINAVRSVVGGGTYVSNGLMPVMVGQRRVQSGGAGAFGLTAREIEILRFICDGYSNKEIARRLDLSVRTVETHRLNVRKKTKATRLYDLVHIARQIGVSERLSEPVQGVLLRAVGSHSA